MKSSLSLKVRQAHKSYHIWLRTKGYTFYFHYGHILVLIMLDDLISVHVLDPRIISQ